MHSCLYRGWVRHRRHAPAGSSFRYGLFMVYVDLAELPTLFDGRWFWSARHPALAWFRRRDYLGPAELPLDVAVRRRVQAATGVSPQGPIRMLTHLRYFGYAMNPVTFYYCFDAGGSRLETLVAEITNTPWDQRHAYVLSRGDAEAEGQSLRWRFGKSFHVSPFMPMDIDYDWRFNEPAESLLVHMQNLRDGQVVFDATLNLHREPVSGGALARALVSFPLVTIKVAVLIYWQALKLLLKRVPFFTHPDKLPSGRDA
jgi:uncharacterized protein